jgi:hypothetical protein
MGWLTGWGYRKSHGINYAAGAGTLYQKQITVHYGSGTDGDDDVYLNSNCRTDFGDVRFTDNDGSTLLDCWRESKVDSDNAVFWVEVIDDLSTVAATIYVYYGKSDATYPYLASETAHGEATFIFFEDFNTLTTGELNGQHGWSGTAARYAVQTSVVKEGAKAGSTTSGADAAGIKHDVTVTAGRMFVQAYLRSPAISTQYSVMVKAFEGTTEITGVYLSVGYKKHLYGGGSEESIESASSDVWYKCKLAFDSLTTHKIWIDDVLKSLTHNTNENNIVTTVTKISIQEYYSAPTGVQGYIDLLIVGKFVYPEPAHGSWGNEETSEPAVMTYLLTNDVIATELWKMLETNPAYSQDITTLVTQAKNAVCTYFKYRLGVTVTVTGDFPDISLAKSGWRTNAVLNGSFAAGTWTFKIALYNMTKYAVSLKIAVRLSKSANADGSNATLIQLSESPNVIALVATAGDIKTDSWDWSAGVVTLTNEYLFAEFRCHIEVASSNAAARHAFICDENPATRLEEIITTTFTPGGPITGWRKLQYLAEPPTTGAFNKLRCASEPPVSGAWNKLLYDGE